LANWTDVATVVNDRMASRGISQRELAERSGVSPATLRKIQHGGEQARNRSTLAGLSRALGFPEDYLWRVAMEGPAAAAAGGEDRELRQDVSDLQRRVTAIESRLHMDQGPPGGNPKQTG
jgi:transcriptional regulator with XRE-family HTH domain